MNINDGTNRPPRLVVYAHSWGLLELPGRGARAWTFEEALDEVAAAAFDGVQAEPERGQQILRRGLRFAAGGRANTAAEIHALIERSAGEGAECLTLHLGWGDESDEDTARLVHAVLESAARQQLPTYIETHRATVLQDLWRTNRLIERIPEIRFNGDYSHYYCAHEVPYRGFDAFREQLQAVLDRTAFFHGRVSNGQAIQVSIADPLHEEHVENFRRLWRSAMRAWLSGAAAGDILPFVPELGPPSSGYAITYARGAERVELADRWQETLLLKQIAQELWSSITS